MKIRERTQNKKERQCLTLLVLLPILIHIYLNYFMGISKCFVHFFNTYCYAYDDHKY
jgi:hypothetical protein